MANIVQVTDDFTNAYWTHFDGSVAFARQRSAPSGLGATRAFDFVEDTGSLQASAFATLESISTSALVWVASAFIAKDAVTSRFPEFGLNLIGGTSQSNGLSLNTSTGAFTTALATNSNPTSGDVIDYDADWWRVWVLFSNSGGNNLARPYLFPARRSGTLDNSEDGGVTGGVYVGGVNVSQDSAVQPFEPSPAYTTPTNVVAMSERMSLQFRRGVFRRRAV